MLALLSTRNVSVTLASLLGHPHAGVGFRSPSGLAGGSRLQFRDFTMSWYYQSGGDTDGSRAALFRCLGPAFADPNLPDVCRATRSSVILARANIAEHLRSGRQRPLLLRAGRVVFSFEGEIEHFKRIRRGCLIAASSDALDAVRGTSEVEMMFAILLTKLQHNVNDALSSTASADLDEQEDRAAALFGLELPLQANVFVNIPAHKGGLQTIFSGGDALAQPREVMTGQERAFTNIFVEGFREGVSNPYGREMGLRENDIVVAVNGISMLGQDFSFFVDAMKAGACVVEVSRFEVYRHKSNSAGAPIAARHATLGQAPQLRDQTKDQDPPLGLFYLHANLSSNATVTCVIGDHGPQKLDTVFDGGYPWLSRPPGRNVRPMLNIFVAGFNDGSSEALGKRCGLRKGDIIVAANGQNVLGEDIDTLISALQRALRQREDIVFSVYRPNADLLTSFADHVSPTESPMYSRSFDGDEDEDGVISPPGFEDGSFVPKTPPLLDESLDGSLVATSFDDTGSGTADQRPQQATEALAFSTGKRCPLQCRSPRNSSSGLSAPRGRNVLTHARPFAPDQLVQSLADTIRQVQDLLVESGLPHLIGALTLTDGETMIVSRVGPLSASEGMDFLPALNAAEAHNDAGGKPVLHSPPPPLSFCFGPASALESGLVCSSAVSSVESVASSSEDGAARTRITNESLGVEVPSPSSNPTSAKKKKRFKVKNPFKKRKPKGGDKMAIGGASSNFCFEDEADAAALVLRSEADGCMSLGDVGDTQVCADDRAFLAARQPIPLKTDEYSSPTWQWYPVAANAVIWCSRGQKPKAKSLASLFQ